MLTSTVPGEAALGGRHLCGCGDSRSCLGGALAGLREGTPCILIERLQCARFWGTAQIETDRGAESG